MKVAVIGGGPAGLTTLKFLLEAHKYFPIDPIEARLFEKESQIGGTFVCRVYEDAEVSSSWTFPCPTALTIAFCKLVSSKYLTAFSDFRFPADAPDFVTPKAYVDYLESYADAFGLWQSIQRNTRVVAVKRHAWGGQHIVTLRNGDVQSEWTCDAVALCSGVNAKPILPQIAGIERVPTVLHSSEFKTRKQFGEGTNIVVLGAGETAMDLAHLAVTSPTKSVTLCHRDGFFCAPKVAQFRPFRTSTMQQPRLTCPDHPHSSSDISSEEEAQCPSKQARRHLRSQPLRHRLRPPASPAKLAPLDLLRCLDQVDALAHLRHPGRPRPVGWPDQPRPQVHGLE